MSSHHEGAFDNQPIELWLTFVFLKRFFCCHETLLLTENPLERTPLQRCLCANLLSSDDNGKDAGMRPSLLSEGFVLLSRVLMTMCCWRRSLLSEDKCGKGNNVERIMKGCWCIHENLLLLEDNGKDVMMLLVFVVVRGGKMGKTTERMTCRRDFLLLSDEDRK